VTVAIVAREYQYAAQRRRDAETQRGDEC